MRPLKQQYRQTLYISNLEGNSHTLDDCASNGIYLAQAGNSGEYLGKVEIHLDCGKIMAIHGMKIPMTSIKTF